MRVRERERPKEFVMNDGIEGNTEQKYSEKPYGTI